MLKIILAAGFVIGLSEIPVHAFALIANNFDPNPGPTQFQGIWDTPSVGAGGSNVSQSSSPNTTFGFDANKVNDVYVADNFTVPVGKAWTVNEISLYAYQTNAVSFPFSLVDLQIVSGADVNGAPLHTINNLSVSNGSGGIVARRASTSTPLTSDARRIWDINALLPAPVVLQSGDYWLRWGIRATNASNLFIAPIVPTNGDGNAYQSVTGIGGTYTLLRDTTSSRTVELPFLLAGNSVNVPSPLPISGGLVAFAWCRKLRRRVKC